VSAVRGVLFDAVGTLIELTRSVGEIYADAARRHGVDLPAWRIDDAFARILAQARPMVFPSLAPAEAAERERDWWHQVVRATFRATDQEARFQAFDACFDELWQQFAGPGVWRERPLASRTLRSLKARGLSIGVVSNFDQRLPDLLDSLGLLRDLDAVVLPAHAGAAKPDRRIFDHALAAIGLPAAQAAYVGDDPTRDLAGARAAGLTAIDVTSLATLTDLPALLFGRDAEAPT
jgi:putative hydrolase of the HAD superfamily